LQEGVISTALDLFQTEFWC